MKSMLAGFAVAALLAFGAWMVLEALDFTAAERVAAPSVRLGDAGPEDHDLLDGLID
jgi:hypothetical protein